MLARLQQAITIGLLISAAAWAAVWWAAGRPGVALAGVIVLLFGHAVILAIEFAWMHAANRQDPAPRATWWQVLRAWASEVITAPRVFCWRQPFREFAVPDHLPPPGAPPRTGIVFVHGFVCNRGVWNPWLRRLKARGVPFIAISADTIFGSIDAQVPAIEQAVGRLSAASGRAPLIVAHSMGGLALRCWLKQANDDERVCTVITIGSPHQGTVLATFAHSTNTRQMQVAGDWLRTLSSCETPGRYARFICFYGHCDNIVFPASSATLPGADNRHVAGVPHLQMSQHEPIFEEIVRQLGRLH